ncbi:MAG: hypothetical protein LBR22_05715 [Desulfovibrio sp.]|nr:hypothetical protein [Desulfovibrio sp.]
MRSKTRINEAAPRENQTVEDQVQDRAGGRTDAQDISNIFEKMMSGNDLKSLNIENRKGLNPDDDFGPSGWDWAGSNRNAFAGWTGAGTRGPVPSRLTPEILADMGLGDKACPSGKDGREHNTGKGQDTGKGQNTAKGQDTGKGQNTGKEQDMGKEQNTGKEQDMGKGQDTGKGRTPRKPRVVRKGQDAAISPQTPPMDAADISLGCMEGLKGLYREENEVDREDGKTFPGTAMKLSGHPDPLQGRPGGLGIFDVEDPGVREGMALYSRWTTDRDGVQSMLGTFFVCDTMRKMSLTREAIFRTYASLKVQLRRLGFDDGAIPALGRLLFPEEGEGSKPKGASPETAGSCVNEGGGASSGPEEDDAPSAAASLQGDVPEGESGTKRTRSRNGVPAAKGLKEQTATKAQTGRSGGRKAAPVPR